MPDRAASVSDLSGPSRLHSDPLAGIFTPFRLSRPCGTDRPILYALFRRRAKNSPGYSDGTSIARPVENCKPSALNPALWKARHRIGRSVMAVPIICGLSRERPGFVPGLSLIHISEPTRLGMISYAVFCLKKKKKAIHRQVRHTTNTHAEQR